jgi:hypothetical protein
MSYKKTQFLMSNMADRFLNVVAHLCLFGVGCPNYLHLKADAENTSWRGKNTSIKGLKNKG